MRKGIGVSPGVVVGKAYCIDDVFVGAETKRLTDDEVSEELERYEAALEKTLADLRALARKVTAQVGFEQAAVFRTHESILLDPAFNSAVRAGIAVRHESAPLALRRVLEEYTVLSQRTRDPFLKHRLADLCDVIVRLSEHLSPALSGESEVLPGPVIVVTKELLPWQIVALGTTRLMGIVTQRGGQTSHAAMLARRRGIPAVTGIANIARLVKNGDTLIVDGRSGHVLPNPDAETQSAYHKLEREFFDLKDALAENRQKPAVTADGQPLELLANINGIEDARAAVAMGATGVGLYRTEYLFLTHRDMPGEEEQLANYRQIIDASPQHRVTIRTLDLGGDKTVSYLGNDREANPFMGWRSIRLSFAHPEIFLTQIRAVLRAAARRNGAPVAVQLLFPMITNLEEIRRVRSMVRKAQRKLRDQGQAFGEVPIGLMLEVPAAAVTIDSLLKEVDFVAIGSNDLVQYLMAADRDNPKVSHLCQPLSPPVLRVLERVINACNRAGKPVVLCGEMAGRPRAFILLLGMGLRSFSMSPASIPTIKDLASHVTIEQARRILRRAKRLKTTTQVTGYLAEQIEELAPSLQWLDSA